MEGYSRAVSAYLFDTTLLLDYMKNPPDPPPGGLAEEVFQLTSTASYSPISEAEVWTGRMTREEEVKLSALLSVCQFAPLTSEAARRAGELLRNKDRSQIKAHFADALIAATAALRSELVATADARSHRVFGDQVQYKVYR